LKASGVCQFMRRSLIYQLIEQAGPSTPSGSPGHLYLRCCITVSIDQARQHDRIASVDDLGIIDLKVRSDRRNPCALDQHVALREIAKVGIEGEDRASPKQRSAS
jgi:hypothetical protein